ncbi:MAG: Eco57I restriction-modification methylase domain-containing protein [Bacteroidales bacterium]|nr:Eco57I restriction-modification methylase domain-containing protein [Bacteroidales bacterium]
MSDLYTNAYNPDVLSCLANLSSDEVFTPPHIVNHMLDMLPQELFKDKNAKFLDPATKSGVFLREIAKRLLEGLKEEIPNLQQRIDHIFQNQLFGIAVTEMTSLLSRRSVYCSKYPNSKYSISVFDNVTGNIRYRRINHNWVNKKCSICGASKETYDRSIKLENYAHEFIHVKQIEELNNMKFDVIIGNPPYQLGDGGGKGSSAVPIYQLFVEQSMKLKPKYITMIIPARWFSGGKGLDNFRNQMLNDKHLVRIVDYFDPQEVFPGIDLSGGVCYFLWDRDNPGQCSIDNYILNQKVSMKRDISHSDSHPFIRFNEAVSIINKIKMKKESKFIDVVSSRRPYGLDPKLVLDKTGSLKVYSYPENGFTSIKNVKQNLDMLKKYKVFITKAYGERGAFPYMVTGKPFIGLPNEICTETYLSIGSYDNRDTVDNVISYMKTKFFRFLVLQQKNTQNAAKGVYAFVPMVDFSKPWSDEELFEKYDLTKSEISFIDTLVKPME